ncbi:hypothetical protein OHC33_002628 [Knufia fluminis]|uniref:Uncharacterized protein n=1 Tax=Knufia fluminis TaxID=191047 RepID=A0AAN8EUC7_9EURO|nr:hypothetical protein OHC33_002628 [Knufia fluminis]
MGKFTGKCVLSKFLPCKREKNDDVPPPPPPPPPPAPPAYSEKPSYNHASMQYSQPAYGMSATHMPAAMPGVPHEGFHTFAIQGFSGFVGFPQTHNPAEIMGRLETMNQVMHQRHHYDPSKFNVPSPGPTPSETDKKQDGEVKEKEDKKTSPDPPENDGKPKCASPECVGDPEVRKIKSVPWCKHCLIINFGNRATYWWDQAA